MIAYLTCHSARLLIEEFVDGELPVNDQVALDGHLRWCDTCRARVEDMRLIGSALRLRSGTPTVGVEYADALAAMQSEVLALIGAERDQSLSVRARELLGDMRLFWPALAATTAVLICLGAITGVSSNLRGVRPDSMAALISMLANPGSDENPLQLDGRMLAPRTLDVGAALASLCDEDAVFTVAAVVTREGRVSNYAVVQQLIGRTAHRETPSRADDITVLSDTVRQSRFAPAQTADGAVAVNMVWLLARTTVKAPFGPGEIGALPPHESRDAATGKSINARLARPVLRPARS